MLCTGGSSVVAVVDESRKTPVGFVKNACKGVRECGGFVDVCLAGSVRIQHRSQPSRRVIGVGDGLPVRRDDASHLACCAVRHLDAAPEGVGHLNQLRQSVVRQHQRATIDLRDALDQTCRGIEYPGRKVATLYVLPHAPNSDQLVFLVVREPCSRGATGREQDLASLSCSNHDSMGVGLHQFGGITKPPRGSKAGIQSSKTAVMP